MCHKASFTVCPCKYCTPKEDTKPNQTPCSAFKCLHHKTATECKHEEKKENFDDRLTEFRDMFCGRLRLRRTPGNNLLGVMMQFKNKNPDYVREFLHVSSFVSITMASTVRGSENEEIFMKQLAIESLFTRVFF